MYNAFIKAKSFYQGDFKVEVEFVNGVERWSRTFMSNSEDNLDTQIANEIRRLNDLATFSAALPIGAYTPKVTTQTQEDIDKQRWFRQFNRLEQLTKLNTLGALRPALQVDLDELRAKVSTDFRKAYINDM